MELGKGCSPKADPGAFWEAARFVDAHDLQSVLAHTHEPSTLEDLREVILLGRKLLLDSKTARTDQWSMIGGIHRSLSIIIHMNLSWISVLIILEQLSQLQEHQELDAQS